MGNSANRAPRVTHARGKEAEVFLYPCSIDHGLRAALGWTWQFQFAHQQAAEAPMAGESPQAKNFRCRQLEGPLACWKGKYEQTRADTNRASLIGGHIYLLDLTC